MDDIASPSPHPPQKKRYLLNLPNISWNLGNWEVGLKKSILPQKVNGIAVGIIRTWPLFQNLLSWGDTQYTYLVRELFKVLCGTSSKFLLFGVLGWNPQIFQAYYAYWDFETTKYLPMLWVQYDYCAIGGNKILSSLYRELGALKLAKSAFPPPSPGNDGGSMVLYLHTWGAVPIHTGSVPIYLHQVSYL